MTIRDVDQMRDDVEAHLRAGGVRPLLVSRAGIDSPHLMVYLQSTMGDAEVALAIVLQVQGVRSARFREDTNRSILEVKLR